jgi:cytochrome c biogenesis factor
MEPSLNVYRSGTEPVGSPSIHPQPSFLFLRDVHAALLGVAADGRTATVRITTVPGVALLWLGALAMAAGAMASAAQRRRTTTPIVMLPRVPADDRVPA